MNYPQHPRKTAVPRVRLYLTLAELQFLPKLLKELFRIRIEIANLAQKSAIIDILTWVECFNSYIAVLTTFYPPRSRDFLACMALIVRTAKRFVGTAWLDYDRAFQKSQKQ